MRSTGDILGDMMGHHLTFSDFRVQTVQAEGLTARMMPIKKGVDIIYIKKQRKNTVFLAGEGYF